MQTDIITVTNGGVGAKEAVEEASKFAIYTGLDNKSALRVRLLAEETIGMVEALTGEFTADFHIESDKKCAVRICLTIKTPMDFAKKKELIEASSDKKNAAAKGFMGKIRQLIENGLYSIDEVGSLQAEYGTMTYMNLGMCEMTPGSAIHTVDYMWSLENYRNSMGDAAASGDTAKKEAWDELEKSIVANIADDVRVGVKGNTVEMIIEKRKF
jgi:hypothetical protein